MNKLYLVIMQDEYNNLYEVGYFKSLDDAIPEINQHLSAYNIELKPGSVKEYVSTFDWCFDATVSDLIEDWDEDECPEAAMIMIRGFIYNAEKFKKMINKVYEGASHD